MYSMLFAATMRGVGLDDRYGVYAGAVLAITLASFTTMSMFGSIRHRKIALMGHLAALKMTSAITNRLYADGFQLLGFDATVPEYSDAQVEADAVQEQVTGRDLAGSLAHDDRTTGADIMFGASTCLTPGGQVADQILTARENGKSCLRTSPPITARPDGPLLVRGDIVLQNENGEIPPNPYNPRALPWRCVCHHTGLRRHPQARRIHHEPRPAALNPRRRVTSPDC
ncbi:iron-containing redox enzyme family protein [Cryobacterium algoricola]|uniref:Iron-containing redox enzyme family protein n=1 Tax=Cryobacterium algoricola TaxID=1259183 RepID=A0ABY2ICY5_9MICO|nr:iron-containing redox enzyme family protein [Cryobacterium algoricola]